MKYMLNNLWAAYDVILSYHEYMFHGHGTFQTLKKILNILKKKI